jgi:outer membrane protein, protease secretion system
MAHQATAQPKHPKWVLLCTLMAAAIGMPLSLLAQERNLAELLDQARRNDAQLQAAQAALRSAEETLPQALAAMRPNISLRINRGHNDLHQSQLSYLGQSANSHTQYFNASQNLLLQQPIFQPQLEANERIALETIAEAQAQLRGQDYNLAIRVASAYIEALTAQDALQLAALDVERSRWQVDGATKAWQSGTGAQSDVDAAAARLAISEASLSKTQGAVHLAHQALMLLVQAPLDKVTQPSLEAKFPETPAIEWSDALAQANANNPQVQAYGARLRSARHALERAKAAHLPTLSAYAQVGRNRSDSVSSLGSNNRTRSLGIELNVPIYAGGAHSSEIRQAQAQLDQAAATLAAAQRDVALQLHQEHAKLQNSWHQANAMRQALSAAKRLLSGSQRLLETGYKSRVDVIDARRQLQEIKNELNQTRYQALVSQLRWASLTGNEFGNVISQFVSN